MKKALGPCEDVCLLPIEDTLWLLDEQYDHQIQDEDTEDNRCLVIYDKTNTIIGSHLISVNDGEYIEQCRALIRQCVLHPAKGVPRRPLKLTFKNSDIKKKANGLDISDLGISLLYAGTEQGKVGKLAVRWRECSNCRLRASQQLFITCSDCEAVLYCSEICRKLDWERDGMTLHSHKHWCQHMKSYMTKHATLRNLPFSFIQETTSDEFDLEHYHVFLEGHGVYNQGAWRRECPTQHQQPQYGELTEDEDDPVVLPVESVCLDSPLATCTENVVDWESYFKHRGFRLDSPIAILLQWPLTIYYIVKYCLPKHDADLVKAGQTLQIDILGVEREVELLPLFKELSFLLPDLALNICMYGTGLSKSAAKLSYRHGNLNIRVVRGLYHKRCLPDRKPHLVIGFNAGIGAYESWTKTLMKLKIENIPAYFTDYCQYSCECARLAMQQLNLGSLSGPFINPFRSPVRKLSTENNMPWYSNGFYYHLTYS